MTKNTIEIFFQGTRVASHQRSIFSGRFSTLEEHMPIHHRGQMEQTVGYFLSEAEKIGPWTVRFMQGVFDKRKHPALGYRTCQGVLRLAKKYGPARIEAACQKASAVSGFAYRTLESLLVHNLDQIHQAPAIEQKIIHLNIRGANYYQNTQEE